MKLNEIANVGEIMDIKVRDIVARAKIERLCDQERFVIGQPTYKLVPLRIHDEEPCDFWFTRENGIFSFIAVLENEFILDDLWYCTFRVLTPVARNQRREAFRLLITLDVTVRFLNDTEAPAFSAKTIDLSQGGVMLSLDRSLDLGTKLLLSIKLYDNVAFVVNAIVKRCEPPNKKQGEYRVAAQFIWNRQRDQAYLGRYIFRKEIMQRMSLKESEFKIES